MRLAGCSPAPSERGKWLRRKKTVFSKLASDFVPSLALVKSLLKPPSAKVLLNLLALNWSRKKSSESHGSPQPRTWVGGSRGQAGALPRHQLRLLPARHAGRASHEVVWSQQMCPFCPRLSQATDTSKKGLKSLPAELCFTCHGLYLTTTFLLHEHQPS